MRAQNLSRLVLSDQERCPNWRAALAMARRGSSQTVGLILRDYGLPQRAELARDMAAHCARENIFFAVAGDARLAAKCGAAFHCPSHLLASPAARLGRALACDLAAVHNETQMHQAAKAGFGSVLLSPVFATKSHPNARPLGSLRARALAQLGREKGLHVFALGGMNEISWRRLNAQRLLFQGYAAIDAFVPKLASKG